MEEIPATSEIVNTTITAEILNSFDFAVSHPNLSLESLKLNGDGKLAIAIKIVGTPGELPISSNLDYAYTDAYTSFSGNFPIELGQQETDSIAYYESILKGNWVMHFNNSVEKGYYTFYNVPMDHTGQKYGGIGSDGQPYELGFGEDKIGYVEKWHIEENENGYFIGILLPNLGHYVFAYIRTLGNLEFFDVEEIEE